MEDLFDLDNLDDNVFGGDFASEDGGTPNASTTPADEEPAEDEDEDQPEVDVPPVQQAKPDGQDQGPGNLKVALKQEREQRQALQQQFQALQAQLTQLQERDQQAAYQAQLERDVASLDPEDVPAYLQAKEQERQQALQQQFQAQQMRQTLQQSEDFARAYIQDYDTQVGKVMGTKANPTPYAQHLAAWAAAQSNPAQAIYEFAKSIRTDAEFQAAVDAEVQSRLAQQQTRSTPNRPSPPPAPRLASIPAAAKPSPSTDPLKGIKRGLASQVGSESWHAAVNEAFERASG